MSKRIVSGREKGIIKIYLVNKIKHIELFRVVSNFIKLQSWNKWYFLNTHLLSTKWLGDRGQLPVPALIELTVSL